MGLGKVGDARRVFYSLRLGSGAPAAGVALVDMAVTIDDPTATATSSPAPVEIGGGRYYFDIPGAFSTANGAGTYGGNVVVASVAPRVVDVVPFEVDFFVNDVDDIAADHTAILARLPATLIGGLMRSHVQALDAGVIDAAAIATDAIDADALAADAVTEIQTSILSDATPFPGANIDATISSRSDFDETTDPVELLDAGGAAGTSAAELVVDIEAALSASHGVGSWVGIASSLTPEQDDRLRLVWKVLGLDPLQPTTHVTATVAIDGSITTPDSEVDITVDQLTALSASFTNA